MLTVEQDNLPPQDGIMKLYESIEEGFDVVSGLYWTKGDAGQPMIYGDRTSCRATSFRRFLNRKLYNLATVLEWGLISGESNLSLRN